jgi:hypothetical protein
VEIFRNQTKSTKAGNALGVMDARTLARLTRVNIGLLNVWAHRGLLPGLEPGVRGRRRTIGPSAATRVLIFTELVEFGFSPDDAHRMVSAMPDVFTEEGFLIVPKAAPGEEGVGRKGVAGAIIHERNPANIARATARQPPIYLVIDIPQLAARVSAAEAEWERSRGSEQPND